MNRLLPTTDLENLQKDLGYRFRDDKWLKRALTHESHSSDHNQRLEFLGDLLVNSIIGIKVYELYKDREGSLTQLKSKIICNENLHRIAKDKLNLDKYILYKDLSGSRQFYLADFFEAILGAIYEDSGSQESPVKQVVMLLCWEPQYIEEKLTQSRRTTFFTVRPGPSSNTLTLQTAPTTMQPSAVIFGSPLASHSASTFTNNKRKLPFLPQPQPKGTSINERIIARPKRLKAANKFTNLEPKADTYEDLAQKLRAQLISRGLADKLACIKVLTGKHPKREEASRHSVKIVLPPFKEVQGFGGTAEGAKVNAMKEMLQVVTNSLREPTTSIRTSPRKAQQSQSLNTTPPNVEEMDIVDVDDLISSDDSDVVPI